MKSLLMALAIVTAVSAGESGTDPRLRPDEDRQEAPVPRDREARERAFYATAVPMLQARVERLRSFVGQGRANHLSLARARLLLLAARKRLGLCDEAEFQAELPPLRAEMKRVIESLTELGRYSESDATDALLHLEWVSQDLGLIPYWPVP